MPCLPTAHSMCFTGWLNCSSVPCAQTKLNVRFKLRTGARVDVILVSLHFGERCGSRCSRTKHILCVLTVFACTAMGPAPQATPSADASACTLCSPGSYYGFSVKAWVQLPLGLLVIRASLRYAAMYGCPEAFVIIRF